MDTKNEERKIKMSRIIEEYDKRKTQKEVADKFGMEIKDVSRVTQENNCLLYTSPSPRDPVLSRMPSSA